MKKILVVLTILVLVAGSAFADFSGSVEADYTVVLGDSVSAGYTPDNTALLDAKFTLDEQVAPVTGEGSVFVDFALSASIDGKYSYSALHWDAPKTVNALAFSLSVDKFDIVGEGWKLNLLNAKGAATDFAVSAIDSNLWHEYLLEEKEVFYTFKNAVAYAPGVTFTYKDFVVGAGFATKNLKDAAADITLEAKTPVFTLGEGITFQAGAGFSQANVAEKTEDVATVIVTVADIDGELYIEFDDFLEWEPVEEYVGKYFVWEPISEGAAVRTHLDGYTVPTSAGVYAVTTKIPVKDAYVEKKYALSAKFAYEGDVKASVAIDAQKVDTADIAFDLAANLQVAPVTVDVYYANKTTSSANPKKATKTVSLKELLSAKAVIALGDVIENVPVTLTLSGKDLLKKNAAYTNWSVSANTTAVKDFDITFTVAHIENKDKLAFEGDVIYTGIENLELEADVTYKWVKELDVELSATYTAEKYKTEGSVGVYTDFEDTIFALGASIESDKLVSGATVKAAWSDFGVGYKLENSVKVSNFGLISLSCKVAF